jgi:hypothetical protein
MEPVVEITESGRGGSIYYREGANQIRFDWEFGGGSTLALLFGDKSEGWDARHPWAAGRQAEIFEFVAKSTVEQKARGHRYKIELDSGDITIY